MLRTSIVTVSAIALLAAATLAQVPTFRVVDSGLDAILGNAGKGIFDPQVAGLTGVAFGNGQFVAVANSSREDVIRWATSPDGLTWTPRSQAIGGGMQSFTNTKVHFLNGQFMFFAEHSLPNGKSTWVYVSADGLAWTPHKIADGRQLAEEFDAGPTLTVLAGRNGSQFVSSDLVTWTPDPAVGPGSDHNDIAYGGGRFISTVNGFGGQTFYSSPDALTWTPLEGLATPGGGRVESGNGVILLNLGSDRWRSTDGVSFDKFTPTTTPPSWLIPGGSPRFTGGSFVASAIDLGTSRSGYMRSSDGRDWTPVGYYNPAPPQPVGQSRGYFHADITYGNGTYVIAGQDIAQTISTKTTLPLIMVLEVAAAPSPTATPTATSTPAALASPTPTRTPGGSCIGNCDGEGSVTINELVLGVNIALGRVTLDQCTAFDADGSGDVTINELIAAVRGALNGCGG